MSTVDSNSQIGEALRVVLPVIYIIIAIINAIGTGIALQIICANRFRHKSLHILICSLLIADFFYTIIYLIIKCVSYAYLSTIWFINPDQWCTAEMYLLKIFDFVLAYTIVFLCIDRLITNDSCCFCMRRLRTGFITAISIWIASAYILIPILLFKQKIYPQTYGGFMCSTSDESVPLFWLGDNPRRALDFIDIVFRTYFPIFLMLLILAMIYTRKCLTSKERQNRYASFNASTSAASSIVESPVNDAYRQSKLRGMVTSYVIIFIICQLPFEIYRSSLLWNQDIETSNMLNGLTFAIEIPLLMLKLINRAVNPFLFICLADESELKRNCCRLWCCPCFPCCIGCRNCWCTDCADSIKYEMSHCLGGKTHTDDDTYVPTGFQRVTTEKYIDGDKLITKKIISEEYETGVQPYYKNPRMITETTNSSILKASRPMSEPRTSHSFSTADSVDFTHRDTNESARSVRLQVNNI